MYSAFVFFGLIFVMFAANGAKSLPLSTSKGQTPVPAKNCGDKMVVCNCNVNQDSHKAMKALKTKIEHLIALVNKTSTPQPTVTPSAIPPFSCKEQYEKHQSSKSQVYTLMFGSQKIPVYCHMGDFGCGVGGWTLAMKIDGTKRAFHYNSKLWSDKNAYNLAGGKTGFDHLQTKLPTYWDTPFSKICLGMKIGHQTRFIVINQNANSLYSLIADGIFRHTSMGHNTWKTLIGSQASLQVNCNKEGFNAACTDKRGPARARIGILANNEDDCDTCDSRIGFGGGGHEDDSNTGGNDQAGPEGDNGDKRIKAMGYILVQ